MPVAGTGRNPSYAETQIVTVLSFVIKTWVSSYLGFPPLYATGTWSTFPQFQKVMTQEYNITTDKATQAQELEDR